MQWISIHVDACTWKFSVWLGLDSTEIMMKVCGSYDSPPCTYKCVHFEICSSSLQLEVVEMLRKLRDYN